MPERKITTAELYAVIALADAAAELSFIAKMNPFGGGVTPAPSDSHNKRADAYLDQLDNFLATLPEPPTATLSPGASGAAAEPNPPLGGGNPSPGVTAGLLTYEGLIDALTAFHAEIGAGTFQPDPNADFATQQFNYIIRHAERASDEAGLAAARKAVAA